MIIVLDPDTPPDAVDSLCRRLTSNGVTAKPLQGLSRPALVLVGDAPAEAYELWRDLPHVHDIVRVEEPFRLASRRFRRSATIVSGPWGNIGGDRPWLAVEPIGYDRVADMPHGIAAGRPFDAAVLRGQALPRSVGALACLPLERNPGNSDEVVFVHRVPSWGANKWIGLAERELADGRTSVVLLEAGGEYPNGARTLEIAAIARAKIRTHLPIVVDASTIAQRALYVHAVAQAAIAAGADGVIVRAWAGGSGQMPSCPATLPWDEAVALGQRLRAIAAAARG